MYLLIDFCCALLAHIPIYIAPSFVKLFLHLYSGLGEIEGRERNRKENSTKTCPPAFWNCSVGIQKDQFINLIIWNVKCSSSLHLLRKEQCALCHGQEVVCSVALQVASRKACQENQSLSPVAASLRHRKFNRRLVGLRTYQLAVDASMCVFCLF